jgi:hypothetical protein
MLQDSTRYLQHVVYPGDCYLAITATTEILTVVKHGVCLVKAMLRMIKYVFASTLQHQLFTYYRSLSCDSLYYTKV